MKNQIKEATKEATIEEMEAALREIGFFVGGLSDEGIKYYYYKKFVY